VRITRSVLIPVVEARSGLSDTARIALPVRVFISRKATPHNASSATTPVIRSRGVTPIGPMLMFCCEPNWANDFGCEP